MNAAIVAFVANGAMYWAVVCDEFLYREDILVVTEIEESKKDK